MKGEGKRQNEMLAFCLGCIYMGLLVLGFVWSQTESHMPKLVGHVLRLKGMKSLKLYIVYYSEHLFDKVRLNLRKFSDESHLRHMKG